MKRILSVCKLTKKPSIDFSESGSSPKESSSPKGDNNIKNSFTHPYQIKIIEGLPYDGHLAIGYLPGKNRKHKGGHSYVWERDLNVDLTRIKEHFGISIVISLVKESEYSNHCSRSPFQEIKDAYRLHDLDLIVYPLKKDSRPEDIQSYHQLMELITTMLSKNKNILLVCTGGCGRTSLVAAGCLIYNEINEKTALQSVLPSGRKSILNKNNPREFISEYVLYANIPIGKDSRSNSSGSGDVTKSSSDLGFSRNGIPKNLLKRPPQASEDKIETFKAYNLCTEDKVFKAFQEGLEQKMKDESTNELVRIEEDYIYERDMDNCPMKQSHDRAVISYKDEVLPYIKTLAVVSNAASY